MVWPHLCTPKDSVVRCHCRGAKQTPWPLSIPSLATLSSHQDALLETDKSLHLATPSLPPNLRNLLPFQPARPLGHPSQQTLCKSRNPPTATAFPLSLSLFFSYQLEPANPHRVAHQTKTCTSTTALVKQEKRRMEASENEAGTYEDTSSTVLEGAHGTDHPQLSLTSSPTC